MTDLISPLLPLLGVVNSSTSRGQMQWSSSRADHPFGLSSTSHQLFVANVDQTPVNCRINNLNVDLLASAIWHVWLSGCLSILGYIVASTTCPRSRRLSIAKSDWTAESFDTTLTLSEFPLHVVYRQVKVGIKIYPFVFVIIAKFMSHHSFTKVCRIDILINHTTISQWTKKNSFQLSVYWFASF